MKDDRIAELELIVRQLAAQRNSNTIDANQQEYYDASIAVGMPQDDPGYYDATAITVMPLGTGPGGARTDTDADLNERDEFT